jgi:hypothetical protein
LGGGDQPLIGVVINEYIQLIVLLFAPDWHKSFGQQDAFSPIIHIQGQIQLPALLSVR